MKLDGLPEGVDAVRIGKTLPGEFFMSEGDIHQEDIAPPLLTREFLIVAPAAGYTFEYTRDPDRRIGTIIKATPQFAAPRIITLTLAARNEIQVKAISEAVDALVKTHPTLTVTYSVSPT
jgi:hypothetical protein